LFVTHGKILSHL